MDQVAEIFASWEERPPTHIIAQTIAMLLGWKPRRRQAHTTTADIQNAPPPGMAVTRGESGMPAPLLDADALGERNRQRMLEIARANASTSE